MFYYHLIDSSSPNALIYRNEQLAKDAGYSKLARLLDYFSTSSSFNAKYDLSAWRGPTQTTICHKNDTTLIVSLQGTTALFDQSETQRFKNEAYSKISKSTHTR